MFVLSFPEMLSSFLEKAFLSAMSVELMNTTIPIALFTFQTSQQTLQTAMKTHLQFFFFIFLFS